MSKQPIRPTTTQAKRIILEPPGGGFLMYRMEDGEDGTPSVEVLEFYVDLETGEISTNEGNPLVFWADPAHSVGYKLVRLEPETHYEIVDCSGIDEAIRHQFADG